MKDKNRKKLLIEELVQAGKKIERLHHVLKMEAIRQLAGGIAHDFDNVLMGVQGNVGLILLKEDLPLG